MEITLYNFTKRKNSTKRPTKGASVEVTLKQNTSIYSPTFMLKHDNAEAYNYLKWDNRYYYINDIVRTNIKDVKEVYCSIDTLATYKNDIGNTSAFVTYSASEHDPYIPDTRLSMDEKANITSASAKLFDYDADGTYVITYISDAPTEGNIGRAMVTPADCLKVGRAIATQFPENVEDFMWELQKYFSASRDALLECRWFPFNAIRSGQAHFPIRLANLDTDATGYFPLKYFPLANISLSIPWQHNDFRNTSRFTSMYLFLPAYGYLELNPDDYVGKSTVNVKVLIDQTNGDTVYIIDKVSRCNTNLTQTVPAGAISQDILQGLGGLASGVIGGITSNPVLAGAGLNTFMSAMSGTGHAYGQSGSTGGGASLLASPETYGYIYLYVFTHDTNIEPSAMNSTNGRPLNKIKKIGDLSGYVETSNISVNTSAPDFIKDELNSYLNGGIYYE